MRKTIAKYILIAAALCCASAATAQHFVGVRGGYGGGSARFYPAKETQTLWGMASFGVSWRHYSKERFVGGVGADLEFMQRGFKYGIRNYVPEEGETAQKPDTSYVRRVNSLVLPIVWEPHFYLFDRRMKVYLDLALTLSYNIDSSYEYESRTHGVYEKGDYPLLRYRDNRWGYGLMGGFGISGRVAGRVELFTELRYYFGYSDILKNKNKYAENPLRSPLDNYAVNFGIYYRLGKSDLLAPRSKKAAARAAARESERLEKMLGRDAEQ